MNRILFEPSEIVEGVATFGGDRAEHVLNVLHGEVGQVLKTGEVDGLIPSCTPPWSSRPKSRITPAGSPRFTS